jgi:hypothetical protein
VGTANWLEVRYVATLLGLIQVNIVIVRNASGMLVGTNVGTRFIAVIPIIIVNH